MDKFILITATFGVPLLFFMTMQDAVATFYRPDDPSKLAYQVVEVEEEEVAEEEEEAAAEPEAEAEQEAEAELAEVDAAQEELAAVEPVEDEVAEAEAEVVTEEEAAVEVAALREADMAAAARAMRGCKSCHQLERERNGVGPHLIGVVGRSIGGIEGFRYSDALLELNEAGEVWSEAALIEWLEDPKSFAEGTKMNFKVRDADDRALIAAWLAANN